MKKGKYLVKKDEIVKIKPGQYFLWMSEDGNCISKQYCRKVEVTYGNKVIYHHNLNEKCEGTVFTSESYQCFTDLDEALDAGKVEIEREIEFLNETLKEIEEIRQAKLTKQYELDTIPVHVRDYIMKRFFNFRG